MTRLIISSTMIILAILSCSKDSILQTEHQGLVNDLSQASSESSNRNKTDEPHSRSSCYRFTVHTESIEVTPDEYEEVLHKMIYDGLSVVNNNCSPLIQLNYNLLGFTWEQRVLNSLIILDYGDEFVKFGFKDLQLVCYSCLGFGNVLCDYDGMTLEVVLGDNSCSLASFQFESNTDFDQFIRITPLINEKQCWPCN